MAEDTYLNAARRALIEEMQQDDTVWALGEDLGRGGVFGQYAGLQDMFGSDRVADTPISEACEGAGRQGDIEAVRLCIQLYSRFIERAVEGKNDILTFWFRVGFTSCPQQ